MDSCLACCIFNAVVGVVVLVLVGLIYNATKKSGFEGTPTLASDLVFGPNSAGADARFLTEMSGLGQNGSVVTTSGMKIGGPGRAGFLGNPEAPVFYDIGDISAAYDTVVAASHDDSEGMNVGNVGKKSGFSVNIDRALAGY